MKAEVLQQRFFEGLPRYRWLETLGRGGVGVVFKAMDLELDEVVAIKVLSPDIERDDEAILARFKREINLNRKIKHPNVARMYDFGISGKYPFITMEFIPGRDLWTIIHEDKRVPAPRVIPILRQIARGCEAVHRLGIVHRDLKSQNIIVDENGAVAILDFGLARATVSESFTLDSIILGTPQYMSPEQASGKPVDARSDIYSIGIIGFEALAGRLPFTGDSPIAVAMKQISEPLPDTLFRVPDVSEGLRRIIHRCLEKDAGARYPSAGELETDLALLDQRAPVPERGAPAPGAEAPRAASTAPSAVQALPRPWPERPPASSAPPPAHASAPPPAPAAPPPPAPGSTPAVSAFGAAAPPQAVSQTISPRRARLPQVLLVSPDGTLRSAWKTELDKGACQTSEAADGQGAIEGLLKKPADLIVMDVSLPGMDGFDTTRVIRSQPSLSQIPVILAADRLDRAQYAFGMQSGAHDLVPRGAEPGLLADKVWKVLKHRGFAVGGTHGSPPSGVRAERPPWTR